MESWQTDILAAVEAAGEGLASAQDQLATAYRLALNHTVLTAAPMSESASIALVALRTARERAVAVGRTLPASVGDFDGLALDLLYLLTCLELLKHAREGMASALESAWAAETGSEPSQPEEGNRRPQHPSG